MTPSYFPCAVLANTKTYTQALATVPHFMSGNMFTGQSVRDAHDAARREAVKGIQPCYIQKLSLYIPGARDKNNSNLATKLHDGYDTFRMTYNFGWLLNDPAADIASAYIFDEERVLFLGHFADNKPVNNSHGYQSLAFNPDGSIQCFGHVDENDTVHHWHLDDALPNAIKEVADTLADIIAPRYADVLTQVIAAQPELQSLKQYLPKTMISVVPPKNL